MMKMRLLVPLGALVVLGGCVTVPVGPAVRVLPGAQKSLEQFQVDDGACRQFAYMAIGGPDAAKNAENAAAANAVAGTLIGAATGAILGSVSNQGGQGAAIGAGTGFLFGSAAGANSAGYSSYALQRSYDTAYMQCMFARGNQVPGYMAYRGPPPPGRMPVYSYPPPNYPAPAPPAENYPPPSGSAPSSTSPTYPPSGTPPSYPPPGTPPPRS
jgi:hypothetical protein